MTDDRTKPFSFARIWRTWGLPLLGKEIAELSVRPRTYVGRVVVGVLMYLAAYLMFADLLPSHSQSALGLLGRGRDMFDRLVLLQFGAVYLFLPVLMAGTIAAEKERNTLVVLFTTRLSPRTILLEKLLSRLIVMGTYLLLSMPLVALTYGLGGVGQDELWATYWMLLVTCVQVGMLGLACSTFCHTTLGALSTTYVALLVATVCCMPINPYIILNRVGRSTSNMDFFSVVGLHSFISGALTILLFVFAWSALWNRAFATPRNFLLEFFKGLDRIFQDMNGLTGGIVLVREDNSLPADEPVSWRETQKRSLGTARYQFRILTAIETPLLATLVLSAGTDIQQQRQLADVLFMVLWPVSVLLIAVQASNLMTSERTRQSLDVLLATPLTGRELLSQKFRSAQRLIAVLSVPFLTNLGFQMSWESNQQDWQRWQSALDVTCMVLALAVYLPLAGWVAMWSGLRFRNPMRAMFVAVVGLIAWTVVPWLTVGNLPLPFVHGLREAMSMLSPAGIVVFARDGQLAALPGHGWPFVTANFLVYATCLWWLRRHCLNNADRYLGRC
jgi:ABC-type transport system involved in multi-copper enzyme maturation permease subunit